MKTRALHLSEAATIGLHALCRLAAAGEIRTSKDLAESLGASVHHMSKIMRKLVAGGIVSVCKGPSGGFYLEKPQLEKTLMEALEAVEGGFNCGGCIYEDCICDRKNCIFGKVLSQANRAFEVYLTRTKIKKFTNKQKGKK